MDYNPGPARLSNVPRQHEPMAATRRPMVPEQIDRLKEGIATLTKLTDELGVRLAPVSRNEPPADANEGNPPAPPCDLAAVLAELGRRVEVVNQQLRGIHERLEI